MANVKMAAAVASTAPALKKHMDAYWRNFAHALVVDPSKIHAHLDELREAPAEVREQVAAEYGRRRSFGRQKGAVAAFYAVAA